MKIKQINFAVFIGILIFISCSKEEDDLISQNCDTNCTEIMGKIMTDNGTVPIPNLKLTVKWDNVPPYGAGIIRTKATATTDSQGNFYLKFLIRDDELQDGGFTLSHDKLDKNKYLKTEYNEIYLSHITRNTSLTINHNVPKKALLNLSLLNLDQVQQGNSFTTEFSYPRPAGFSNSIDGDIRGWNNESKQKHLLEIAGNQPINLKIYRTINGAQTTEIKNIFFEAGKTSDYTVDFKN